MASPGAGRNLVICFDGTSNEFGDTNTNVVRLAQVLSHDPDRQLVYYDPGVGTMPEPGLFFAAARTLSRIAGLAFGRGLTRNLEEAYAFLMETWQPNDQVFVFGFSRGAYTARVLAGLLWQMGLLRTGQQQLVPYAIRLFRATPGRQKSAAARNRYFQLCRQFRATFSRPLEGQPGRQFRTHFAGVWDTVSSVGWIWSPKTFPYTARNPGIAIARHAIALDERRAFFRQNRFVPLAQGDDPAGEAKAATQDLRELWFPGVHSDIGGGYPDDRGALWRVAFDWMVNEAMAAGIVVDDAALKALQSKPNPPVDLWAEPKNESLTWMWWLGEVFPKMRYSERWQRRLPSFGVFRPRRTAGAQLHEAVVRRVRGLPSYRPRNLPDAVIKEIQGLAAVPEGYTYKVAS
jgi:uncharacterized protein (DUF2235 family)